MVLNPIALRHLVEAVCYQDENNLDEIAWTREIRLVYNQLLCQAQITEAEDVMNWLNEGQQEHGKDGGGDGVVVVVVAGDGVGGGGGRGDDGQGKFGVVVGSGDSVGVGVALCGGADNNENNHDEEGSGNNGKDDGEYNQHQHHHGWMAHPNVEIRNNFVRVAMGWVDLVPADHDKEDTPSEEQELDYLGLAGVLMLVDEFSKNANIFEED